MSPSRQFFSFKHYYICILESYKQSNIYMYNLFSSHASIQQLRTKDITYVHIGASLVDDVRCHHKRYPCVLPPRIPASAHNDRNMLFTSCSKCKGVSNSLTSPLANTITLQISNELGFAYYHILCPYDYKRTHSKVLNKHHLSISNQPICYEYSHCLI